jgi:hypothetical protein
MLNFKDIRGHVAQPVLPKKARIGRKKWQEERRREENEDRKPRK